MIYLYDGSFEGFLSVIFESYAHKIIPDAIYPEELFQEQFFVEKTVVQSSPENATRVWKGWQKKLRKGMEHIPYLAFLSGEQKMEIKLLYFARKSFESNKALDTNFSDPTVVDIRKAAKRVSFESMHMQQFVRFQRTKDDIYFCGIQPRYDVLPLNIDHFKDRFADQQWLIYDIKRDYGFYYNLQNVEEVILNDKTFDCQNGRVPLNILQDEEAIYERMWNNYCQSITIRERLNLKLQKQHMPKRFWKFLPEKRALK